MARSEFIPEYFKIKKISKKINILKSISNLKIPFTFNQLMKFNEDISVIFIFNENSIEIPCLLSFCKYFKISLFLLNSEDINEIKSEINYSTMVCVPKRFTDCILKNMEDINTIEDIENSFCQISLNL